MFTKSKTFESCKEGGRSGTRDALVGTEEYPQYALTARHSGRESDTSGWHTCSVMTADIGGFVMFARDTMLTCIRRYSSFGESTALYVHGILY